MEKIEKEAEIHAKHDKKGLDKIPIKPQNKDNDEEKGLPK